MNFEGPKIQPIHLAQLQQGKLYRHSSHHRHKSASKSNSITTPYIDQLAVKSNRSQKARSRQGAVSFSYRRWYDSSINFANMTAALTTPPPKLLRPQTQMKHKSSDPRKQQSSPPTRQFRRNLKCLRDKVKEKIKQVLPEALKKVDLRVQDSREELKGLMCNRIVAWNIKPESQRSRYKEKSFSRG